MKRTAAPLAAILVACALVALLIYGVAQRSESSTLDEAVKQGRRPTAPGSHRGLPRLGEPGAHALADYRGKIVVLNFWASWCEPCKDEAPVLEAAHKRLVASGTGTVLGVTYTDVEGDSKAFVRKFGLTYPIVRDVGTKLAREYGTRALPETFVIDARGRVAALSRGVISKRALDDAIAEAQR